MPTIRVITRPSGSTTFIFAVLIVGTIMFFGGTILYYLIGGGFGNLAVSLLIFSCTGIWLAIWTYKDKILPSGGFR